MTDSDIIPNSLSITIHTDIPGYQNINFKPSMIDPHIGDSSKVVWFNPLVKLDTNVIDKVPKKMRITEFFKKDNFRSLINYHGMQKKKTLEEATQSGFVDNNISVMLNLLFPTKGIIYINKEPYTIANFNWTKGDWKIDNKDIEVPQLDIGRIRNPYTLSHVVNSKIKSGNIALSKLPQSVIQGTNYSGPPITPLTPPLPPAKTITPAVVPPPKPPKIVPRPPVSTPPVSTPPVPRPPVPTPPVSTPPVSTPPVSVPPTSTALVVSKPKSPLIVPAPKPLAIAPPSTAIVKAVTKAIDSSPSPPPKLPILALMPPPSSPTSTPEVIDNNLIARMSDDVLQSINYTVSRNSNQDIRYFFGVPGKSKQAELGFFDMINKMYTNLPLNVKSNIVQMLRRTTNVAVKDPTDNSPISQQAYAYNVMNMNVFESQTNGNCFFDSLQQSINMYNKNIDAFEEQVDRKITYDLNGLYYGSGDNIFTQECLREIVYQKVIVDKNRFIAFARNSLQDINNDFKQAIANYTHEQAVSVADITLQTYNGMLENVYSQFDGFKFLIIYPVYDAVQPLPATNSKLYMEPFTVANTNDDIQNFIMSPLYWGDEVAIGYIQRELNLTAIILTKNEEDQIKIANPQDLLNINAGGKYTFLYHTNNSHYELISFGYNVPNSKKGVLKSPSNTPRKMTIFRVNDQQIPPLSVIFLLFASFYLQLNNNRRQTVQLLQMYLNGCYISFRTIYQNHLHNDDDATLFLRVFNNYFHPFPNSFNVEFPGITNLPSGGGEVKVGGLNRSYPYNSPSYSRNPYTSSYRSPHSYYSSHSSNSPYNRYNSSIVSSNNKNDDISYHIDIYLELQKGKEITDSQISSLNCKQKLNNIKRAFAVLTGKKFVIKPNYDYFKQKKTQKNNNNPHYNNPHYNNPHYNNYRNNITKKNYNNNAYGNRSYGSNNAYGNRSYGSNNAYGNRSYGYNNGNNNGYNNGYNNHYTRKFHG